MTRRALTLKCKCGTVDTFAGCIAYSAAEVATLKGWEWKSDGTRSRTKRGTCWKCTYARASNPKDPTP